MTDLFDIESDEEIMEDEFLPPTTRCGGPSSDPTLDARKRLENMLEEKRLRAELDDFVDY